jgi:hypothetical protein
MSSLSNNIIFFNKIRFFLIKDIGDCEVGWSQAENTCYKAFEDSLLNFNEAKTKCQARGATLAEIKSVKVQTLINNIILQDSGYYWFGLSYTSGWSWINSNNPIEQNDFTNWRLNQPNSSVEGFSY